MDKPSSIETVLKESIDQIRNKGGETGYDEVYIDSVIHEFKETISTLIREKAGERIVKFDGRDYV